MTCRRYRYQKTSTQWLSGDWEGLKGHALKLKLLEEMANSAVGRRKFWGRVRKGGKDECWEWTLSFHDTGYGLYSFCIGPSRPLCIKAHRIAYYFKHRELPESRFICHHCDNRKCVNPRHLFLGNGRLNVQDMVNKKRQAVGRKIFTVKLFPDQVQEIRYLYHVKKIENQYLAEAYKVSDTCIHNVVTGKLWRWLPFPKGIKDPSV